MLGRKIWPEFKGNGNGTAEKGFCWSSNLKRIRAGGDRGLKQVYLIGGVIVTISGAAACERKKRIKQKLAMV